MKDQNKMNFSIAGRLVGDDQSPYIIAELSGNHNGQIGRAFQLIEAAHKAGADAVKIQTYTADTITMKSDRPEFIVRGGLWDGRTLYELYQEAHTPWEWHQALFAKAREIGITIFSSPFDFTAVDFLEGLNAPAYKIASFENNDLPLIQRVARTGKPIIISTGMADDTGIAEAVAAARGAGCRALCLLHCISGYPTPASASNLRTLQDISARFGTVTGLSDHTLTTSTAVVAVALGAKVIEKHMTLARADGGLDASFSLEPHEFKRLVDDCRTAHESLGHIKYTQADCEKPNIIFRRSLYIVSDVKAGEKLTMENVRSIRPGYGMLPKELPKVLGKTAARDIVRGTPMSWDLVVENSTK